MHWGYPLLITNAPSNSRLEGGGALGYPLLININAPSYIVLKLVTMDLNCRRGGGGGGGGGPYITLAGEGDTGLHGRTMYTGA